DGTEPADAIAKLTSAISTLRNDEGPVLIRLRVPRLSGHSGQDTQAYKDELFIRDEQMRDPLPKLQSYLVPDLLSVREWERIETSAKEQVANALQAARNRPEPDTSTLYHHRYVETNTQTGSEQLSLFGGAACEGYSAPQGSETPNPEPARVNLLTAVRRTLEHELKVNKRLLVFGEDVGPKGGVHAATLGLQDAFGDKRVFDTSLSEEGIIGRAVGMAYAGLTPVAEIQFRKYADPAQEQLTDCGTIRWRTNNQFAAPIVVRMPGGHSKCGDPWHSMSDEVMFAHMVGWQVAYPSNAEDGVGLLRSALRSNNPTMFFEHRNLLDAPSARRPYPGDDFIVPFGKAKFLQTGNDVTVITWGAMVERILEASQQISTSVEILDLRTISPWDREAVLTSVEKTGRALIVHEDTLTAGFGAEISAVISSEAFLSLKAPVERLAPRDIPMPYNVGLLQAALPSVELIADKILELAEFE
ncbi:MAG: hypothetical protein KDD55_09505, partial [Bdellovibrionales bacterium]|nr:hypothetical protein [Bdellovibrionales bacterium]